MTARSHYLLPPQTLMQSICARPRPAISSVDKVFSRGRVAAFYSSSFFRTNQLCEPKLNAWESFLFNDGREYGVTKFCGGLHANSEAHYQLCFEVMDMQTSAFYDFEIYFFDGAVYPSLRGVALRNYLITVARREVWNFLFVKRSNEDRSRQGLPYILIVENS